MSDINLIFSRHLLAEVHKDVKRHSPAINLRTAAWVWSAGRDHWEFHGPSGFYWHGRAGNAYEARFKGWHAWLRQGPPCA
jgi:hypothetical protein